MKNQLLFLLCLLSGTLCAQTSPSANEQAIRNLVEQQNQSADKRIIKNTAERVFWSGAFPRPVLANDQPTETNRQIIEHMKTDRLNYRATQRIERLVVAKSGDLAYEYGTGTLDWDTPEKKHVHLDNAYLRAWRKVDNEWREDALFARPLDSGMTAYKK